MIINFVQNQTKIHSIFANNKHYITSDVARVLAEGAQYKTPPDMLRKGPHGYLAQKLVELPENERWLFISHFL